MPLVNYSESDSEPDESQPTEKKHVRKKPKTASFKTGHDGSPLLPPLPNSFHDLYASNVRTGVADDPSLHGGRKRAVPHTEGNWSTHISLESRGRPTTTERKLLEEAISHVQQKLPSNFHIHSHLISELGTALPLHISLSRPIVFTTENKDTFEEQLSQAITNTNMKIFDATPTYLDWVSNWEQTRWFLVLRLSKPPSDSLNTLLNTTNDIVSRFGQPKLYDNLNPTQPSSKKSITRPSPSRKPMNSSTPTLIPTPATTQDFTQNFHISIAWSLDSPFTSTSTSSISNQQEHQQQKLEQPQPQPKLPLPPPLQKLPKISFSSLKIKIGNSITDIPFSSSTDGYENRERDRVSGFGRR